MTLKDKLDILIHDVESLQNSCSRLDVRSTVTVELNVKPDDFEKSVDSIAYLEDKFIVHTSDTYNFEDLRTIYMVAKGFSILIKEDK